MIRCLLVASLVGLLALAAGAAGEITDEDMRNAGLSDEQIQEFKERVEALETRGPDVPTVEDYLAGGEDQQGLLAARIARGEDGLEIARRVIHRQIRGGTWPDRAVMNGLSLRRPTSPAALDLLEALARSQGTRSPLWEYSRRWWADGFRRVHGPAAFDMAEAGVVNTELVAERRALYLFVFGSIGWKGDPELRRRAIEVNRLHLHSPDPALQRAAVAVASVLYDYNAKAEIEQISWSSTDPTARGRARLLFKNFLDLGPDPGSRPVTAGSSIRAGWYDPEGLMEYRAERGEWQKQQDRLLAAEEPRPAGDTAGSSTGAGSSSTEPRARGTR